MIRIRPYDSERLSADERDRDHETMRAVRPLELRGDPCPCGNGVPILLRLGESDSSVVTYACPCGRAWDVYQEG